MKHLKLFESFSSLYKKNVLNEGVRQWLTPEKIRQGIKDGGYESRGDLQAKNPSLYQAAFRNKMLDEFFDDKKWTPEKIRKAIADGNYANRSDLKGKNPSLFVAAYRNNILDEFFDASKWTPEKIRKAIKDVSTKQFCALSKWTKENPDFQNNEFKQNYYTHTLVAIANNKEHNEEKIIKKLCKN